MSPFAPLDAELALWRAEGLPLPIWWRDDDATVPSIALDRLLRHGEELGLAVHLAVIPRPATEALAQRLSDSSAVVLVHGWAHTDHAPKGEKKAEFGHCRPDAQPEASAALSRIKTLFGDRHVPVFVPPWNRIESQFLAALPRLGYRAISTFAPRTARGAAPGLVQVNCHVDPIDWRGGRGLVSPDTQIARLVAHLQDRRQGRADLSEPLGLLTHYLVHDAEIWAFTERLLKTLLAAGAQPMTLLTEKDITE